MSSIQTKIKNLMASHLRQKMFGMDIYGQHEIAVFDGRFDQVCVIEVCGASRFERYGSFVVYHPTFGKWQAALLSQHHTGKPVLVIDADEIRAAIAVTKTYDFLYKVYGVDPPEYKQMVWDPYWEATA